MTDVAIVHDYLTQRGGAERVVLALARTFPEAPIYTSLYDPAGTFPEFRDLDIRVSPLNRLAVLRRSHRAALPLLAPTFSRWRIDADVVLCSSSGWAHGVRAISGRKIVYCYSPAKWLYRPDDYLGEAAPLAARVALRALRPLLERWDRRAASTAERYLAISSFIVQQIREVYGIEPELVIPPVTFDPSGSAEAPEGVEEDFLLVVARLIPQKNVDRVLDAVRAVPEQRLVVVGHGPLEERLRAAAPANATVLGSCTDAELRWLYRHCRAVVAASREDLGLTPLEAARAGKPTLALRWGGFLDTVVDGETGLFFDSPEPGAIAQAIRAAAARDWDADRIREHAAAFSEDRFAERMRRTVYG